MTGVQTCALPICGSKLGDTIYSTGKKVATVAKDIGKAAINGIKKVSRDIKNGLKSFKNWLFS